MRIFVTGAAGTLGRMLVRRLVALADENPGRVRSIFAFDTQPVPKGLFTPPKDPGLRFGWASGDIGEHRSAFDVDDEEPEARVLIHLAGMAHAGRCEENPEAAYAANVGLTAMVLGLARDGGFSHVVFPSTGLVYGGRHATAVDETAELNPPNVYAHTKAAAEDLVRYFADRYELPATVLRIANVYGPGANPDTVAAIVLKQVADSGRTPRVRVRDLRPVRDFVYIQDVVETLADVALSEDLPNRHRTMNLSTGTGTSVYDLAASALRLAGVPESELNARISDERGTELPVKTATDGEHSDRLVMRNDRLSAFLGRSMRSVDEGLGEASRAT